MAEPKNKKKVSLKQILNEIAEDEEFTEEERQSAQRVARELEYKEWCSRQMKSNR